MINRVVLVGRLTRDADLRYTQSGLAVASFTLAVDRNYTNQSGSRDADFLNCVIWRKQAETLSNYTHKGSLIGVDGRLQSRSYENQQGQKVYVTEVIVDNFSLLESRAASQQRLNNSQTSVNNNQFDNMDSNKNVQSSSIPNDTMFNENNDNQGSDSINNLKDPLADSSTGDEVDISDDDLPF